VLVAVAVAPKTLLAVLQVRAVEVQVGRTPLVVLEPLILEAVEAVLVELGLSLVVQVVLVL
jgi:hypothetical protein